MVTPGAVRRLPDARGPGRRAARGLEELIRSTGFFRAKAKSLMGMAQAVIERFGGEVPSSMEELTSLPGVGRKTANVVRSVAFGLPGLPVDTHVGRLTRRLGLTAQTDPVKVESRDRRPGPARGVGGAQPAADPARAQGVPGPHAALRGVRPRRHLPLGVASRPLTGCERYADGRSHGHAGATPWAMFCVRWKARAVRGVVMRTEPVPATWFRGARPGSAARPARATAPVRAPSALFSVAARRPTVIATEPASRRR